MAKDIFSKMSSTNNQGSNVLSSYNILNQEVDFDLKRQILITYNIASGIVVNCANEFYDDYSIHSAIASVTQLVGFILPQIYVSKAKTSEAQKRKINDQNTLIELRDKLIKSKLELLINNDFNKKIEVHNMCQKVLDIIAKKFIFFGMYVERTEEAML